MRLLLVTYDLETGCEALAQLRRVLARHEITERQASAFEPVEADGFDVTVLFGRTDAPDFDSSSQQDLGEWLAATSKPVLACGWGFGVFLTAFGFDAVDSEQIEAATTLIPTEAGSGLFQGTDPLKVEPTIRWSVDREDLPKGLAVLAGSDTGIEAIRHKKQTKIAIQQLPTDFTYPSDGKLAYANLAAMIAK